MRAREQGLQRIDVLIVAALAIAAAASAVGAWTYTDDRLGSFGVVWTLATEEVELEGGAAGAGEPVEMPLDVVRANLTSIAFTIVAASATPLVSPTNVLVEVVSPTNVTTSAEAELPAGPPGSIEVPVEVALADVPDATRVSGGSLDAARAALNATLSSSLGIGTWTIRVSFASSAPGPLGAVESYEAGGTATLAYYEGTLAIAGPEAGR